MRQLEERHVATKVELMVWSNKMDLLALSNVRGTMTSTGLYSLHSFLLSVLFYWRHVYGLIFNLSEIENNVNTNFGCSWSVYGRMASGMWGYVT